MTLVRLVYNEVVGMFIDDGALALLSLILIAAVTAVVKFTAVSALWGALALLVGCLAILAESVRRASRRE